jgi:gliding motility-associated-like protein
MKSPNSQLGNSYVMKMGDVFHTSRFLFSVFACVFFFLFQGVEASHKITFVPWYGMDSTQCTAVPVDNCGSIYRIAYFTSDNDPQMQIKVDGIPLSPANSAFNTDAQSEGYTFFESTTTSGSYAVAYKKGVYDGSNKHGLHDLYLNTNGSTYTLSLQKPTTVYTSLSVVMPDSLVSGQSVTIGSSFCRSDSSVFSGDATYQWQSSEDGSTWSDVAGATAAAMTGFTPIDSVYYRLIAKTATETYTSSAVQAVYVVPALRLTASNAEKLNDYEYEVEQGKPYELQAETDGFEASTFKMQVKTLDFGAAYRDTSLLQGAASNLWRARAQQSLIYKLSATVSDPRPGHSGLLTLSDTILIRAVYACDASTIPDTLWYDNFGYFKSATDYVEYVFDGPTVEHNASLTDAKGKTYQIEHYWAPDVNNFVQNHEYALTDPNVADNTPGDCDALSYKPYRCWEKGQCDGYRVEDGYYAILPNPDYSNCGKAVDDYWAGNDHTEGDVEGGMLFVNCAANSRNTIIYQRTVHTKSSCANTQLLFSAYINNAAIAAGSTPVNVRLDVLDENKKLVYSVASGDIIPRDAAKGEKEWSHLSFLFPSNGTDYTIQITNNMAGGTGNDILLDDICISICYPNIELLTNSTFSRMADTVRTCQTDTAIRLYALNRNNIQTYISNPIYLFQYKNRQSAQKWVDLDTTALAAGVLHHYTSVNTDSVRLSKADKRFWRDTTIFRVMVTSAQNVIDSICKGHLPIVNCDSVYAIDSMAVIYHYSGAMGPDFSKAACEGDTFSVKGVANFKPYATWYNGDGVKLVKNDGTKTAFVDAADSTILHFVLTPQSKDTTVFYFVGREIGGCVTDTQVVHLIKNPFVQFSIPARYKDVKFCEYDSVITLQNVSPANVSFTWNLNGQTVGNSSSSYTTSASVPEVLDHNKLTVTGNAANYCPVSDSMFYTVYKQFTLALASDVQKNKLCLKEAAGTPVHLTATAVPSLGRPSTYYWYVDQDGKVSKLGEGSENTYTATISQNGTYKYTVKAIDGICYKDEAQASATTSAKDSVEAREPITIALTPSDTSICEGGSIAYKVQLQNVLSNPATVTWTADFAASATTVTDAASATTNVVTPDASATSLLTLPVKAQVTDEVCGNEVREASASYALYRKFTLALASDVQKNKLCLKEAAGTPVHLTATAVPSLGRPSTYYWYVDQDGTVSKLGEGSENTYTATISQNGTYKYTVKAIDGICYKDEAQASATTSAKDSVEAREPITIALTPSDTSICEGGSIAYKVQLQNVLSNPATVTWTADFAASATTVTDAASATTNVVTPDASATSLLTLPVKAQVTDEVCGNEVREASASYALYRKFTLALASDVQKNKLCLKEAAGTPVHLTATAVPSLGRPSTYYWYVDQDGTVSKLGEGSENTYTASISQNGTYKYTVKAIDGICYKDESQASATTSAKDSVEAREPITIALTPSDTSICEGGSIAYKVQLQNVLSNPATVTWTADFAASATTVTDAASATTNVVTPVSATAKTEKFSVKALTTDEVCKSTPSADAVYSLHKNLDITLNADGSVVNNEKKCISDAASANIKLTVTVNRGEPVNYVWSDGEAEGKDSRDYKLQVGDNSISVAATDAVCAADVSKAHSNLDIRARQPISVSLHLSDGKNPICVGSSVTLAASVNNTLSGALTSLSWNPDIRATENVANGDYAAVYAPGVGEHTVTVTAAEVSADPVCAAVKADYTLKVQDSTRLRLTADNYTVCQSAVHPADVVITATVTQGAPSSIVWSTGQTTPADQPYITVTPQVSSVYSAYAVDAVCLNSFVVYTDSIKVSQLRTLELSVADEKVQMQDSAHLSVTVTPAYNGIYTWYKDGSEIAQTQVPTLAYQLPDEGTYNFSVSIENGYCGQTYSDNTETDVEDYTIVPNAITPYNGNAKNNVFMKGYRVEIFNRYQQLVYEGNDGWDATYNGKSADPGTYFYRLIKKDGRELKGTVEVVKF